MKRFMYLRVSKVDEEEQDLDVQRTKLVEKYPESALATVFQERGSAYNLEKIGNRTEFFKLIRAIFSADSVTLENFFLANYDASEEVEVYVWDYHRIMRNFELNLLFGLLCDAFRVRIISYKQGGINVKPDEKPVDKFARYIFYSINAFSSEDYSWNISENVKKNIVTNNGITRSKDGLKWGRSFVDAHGNKRTLTDEQVLALRKDALEVIAFYEKLHIKIYHKQLIKKILEKHGVKLSGAYITKLKQGEK